MAKFKERVKMIFNNKLTRAIIVIFTCIVGMSVLGRCSKVEAAAITLPDGSVSKVDITTSQVFNDKAYFNSRLVFNNKNNVIIYSGLSGVYVYYNCTLTSNVLSCSNYKNVSSSGSVLSYDHAYNFEIGYDYVKRILVSNNSTTTFYLDTDGASEEDLNNARQEGYNEGKEDGYNEGYTAGQNTGYNTGYTEGANSVDITQDNEQAIKDYITENNYHTDEEYNSYGESQYNKGYDDGESESEEIVDKNNTYANEMFSKAYPQLQELYKKGEPYATFILGAYYNYGIGGVQKSFKEALNYIKAAAELGHSGALFDLGKFYEIGKGVAKDLNKAYKYYSRAAKIGNVRAKNKIDEMQEKVKDQ